jgi:hypothetical protein
MNSAYDSTLNASQDARQQKCLQLNQQARKLLSSCPKRPARGVHQRLFEPARILQRSTFRLKQEKVFSLIRDAVEHCGRYMLEKGRYGMPSRLSAPSNHKDNGKGPPYKKKGQLPLPQNACMILRRSTRSITRIYAMHHASNVLTKSKLV